MIAFVRKQSAAYILKWLLLIVVVSAFVLSVNPEQVYAVQAPSPEPDPEKTYAELASGHLSLPDKAFTAPEDPTVYLTFDDGPSQYTGKVLDILHKEGIPATFFVLGKQVENHPETVKRIVREGHSLGNHSYSHMYKHIYSSFEAFYKEVEQTDNAIFQAAGFRTRLLRAPGGTASNFDPFYFYFMEQAGYTVFDWDVDSQDSKRAHIPASTIISSVKKAPLKHEMSILFHDGAGHEETVKALPSIIAYFKQQGYRFASLSDQVKPAQFTVGRADRWDRKPISRKKFNQLLSQIKTNTVLTKPSVKKGEVISDSSPSIPLHLTVAKKTVELPAKDYAIRYGKVELPLQLYIENMGGKVTWDESKQTVHVRYGMINLYYDSRNYVIRTNYLGKKQAKYWLPGFRIVDGIMRVQMDQISRLIQSESGTLLTEGGYRSLWTGPPLLFLPYYIARV
ncbi:polysaccharide deacetylase family protein [Paenibacillus larvae]